MSNIDPNRCLVRRPRHRWFSSQDRIGEDGWYGPHKTIEEAVMDSVSNDGCDQTIYVAQGYRATKAEKEEWCSEFDWQVDAPNALEIRLPKKGTQP